MSSASDHGSKLNAALAVLSSAIISPDISYDSMYQLVLEKARWLTESEHGFVSSIDSATSAHISNTLTKMREEGCTVEATLYSLPTEPHELYKGLWGHSLNIRAAFYTNDPASHLAARGLPDGHLPLKNFLSVPIMFGNTILGQIALANAKRDYTEDDLEMISRLGELYAVVLHNRQRENELRRSEEGFRLIVEAAPLPMVITNLETHMVIYSNPRAQELLIGDKREALSKASNYYVHKSQRAAIVKEISEYGRSSDREVKLRNSQGKEFWALLSAVKINWFGTAAMMTAINDITGRKNMEKALEQLATSDYLTGLSNRRRFMELGDKEYERYMRNQCLFSVIIFDLDNFKQVNDTYGHQTGDKVLQETAKRIEKELRDADVVSRYGGEEFAVLLPETMLAEAAIAAERLRKTLAEYSYSEGQSKLTVTASFGVSEVSGDDKSFADSISRADKALYKAKELGRNRVHTDSTVCF